MVCPGFEKGCIFYVDSSMGEDSSLWLSHKEDLFCLICATCVGMVGRQWTIICCTVMLHVKCEVLSFLCLGFSRKCRRVLLVFYLDGGIVLLNSLFFFLDFGSSILVVDSLEREREESLHLKMWKPQWFTWRCLSLQHSFNVNVLGPRDIHSCKFYWLFHLDCNFFISFLVIFFLSYVHFLFTQGSCFYSIKFCYLYKKFHN